MATTDSGATSRTVANNLRRVRDVRKLSLRGLSKSIKEAGWTLSADAINKIENGRDAQDSDSDSKQIRRVTVDDLVALADALNISPLTLLFPPFADDEIVELTPNRHVTARTAWAWGLCRQPAIDKDAGSIIGEDPDGLQAEQDRRRREEFRKAETDYKSLATPPNLREDHRAVEIAAELRDYVSDAVATPPGRDGAQEELLLKARRRWEQLGLELGELAERYSIRFSVGGPPGDPNAHFMPRAGRFLEVPPSPPDEGD